MTAKMVRNKLKKFASLDEQKLNSVLRISQRPAQSVQQLLNDALEEVVELFESRFGYIYYYCEESTEFTLQAWSQDVMEACSIPNPPTRYHLDKTGLWGEAVRQRRPIVVNDFPAPHPHKKGYPEGHAVLTRFMTIPVIIDEQIVAVVGLANKAGTYTDQDVRQLTLLMDSIWTIVQRKQAEDNLYITNTKLLTLITLSQMSEETIDKIGAFALEGAIQLTQSAFGVVFLHDAAENRLTFLSWSRQVMENCGMENPPDSFGIDDMGLLGRAVRQGEATVINDYSVQAEDKHGYPPGHLPITRFINVPVIDDGQVVLCAAVANKQGDYFDQDVQLIQLIMHALWRIIQKKRSDDTIRRMNEVLEQRVAERTEELNRLLAEQQKTEETLRQSEARYSALFDNAGDGIMILDTRGRILSANKVLCSRLGYSEEELRGKTPAFFDTPRYAAQVQKRMQQIAETGEAFFEAEHVSRDGRIIPVEISSRVVESGGQTVIMSIVRDSTERTRAEHELRESRQQLANIIDFLPDATFVIDNDMKIIAWNRAMEEMSGVKKEEMLGQGDRAYSVPFYGERRKQLLDLLDVSDAELEAKYKNIQRKGETLNAEVFVPVVYGGRGAYVWASGAPLYSTDNRRVGAIEIIRDISERKKVEQDLQQATLAAEAANRAKSEFLANMSHEIRTPMNAITGMAYLALQTDLEPRQREYVERIRSAADSLLAIINDILDFSKIEAGKMELESVCFELDEVFSSLCNLISSRAEEKNLEILFSRSPEIPDMLLGDPLRLGQILNNLVSNAIKFTETGSIVISVAAGRAAACPGHIALKFSVADTGIGMDHEHLERIFTPFTQADASITRRFGGTGLGLSIVSRLLELMGSGLEVESEAGRGSTFSFTVEFGVPSGHVRRAVEPPPDLRGMSVLVVDDSPDACRMLESMLSTLSFKAVSVGSGAAALAELARAATTAGETPYRMVLLDWRMPGLDGIETARRIRLDSRLKPTPEMIIISGYVATAIQEEARELGIRVLLTKPPQMSTLFNAIMDTLGEELRHPARQETSLAADGVQPLYGIRVLLVEDNKVNQIVAREILKRFGVEVVTADNGLEAVEAVAGSTDFDMVFMDIQMPELDGYGAASAIRRIRGELELPIIAMTAHVFSEERDNCLSAGMNDHVAKPVDPDQLYSVLLRWIRPGKVIGSALRAEGFEEAGVAAPFPDSLPGINLAALLVRCGGNRSLARKVVTGFSEQNRSTVDEIRAAVERGDTARAAFMVHSLKGLSATIGASGLSQTMLSIETALKEGRDCLHLLDAMQRQMAEIFEAAGILDQLSIGQEPDSAGVTLPPDELVPLMAELHDALRDNDLGAVKLFEGLKYYLGSTERDEIQRFMSRLDFAKAMAALERAARSSGIVLHRGEHDQ